MHAMRGAIYAPEAVAEMAVLKRLERYGPDGAACFPRGCTFSDIDGVVELRGYFLFLEVKRTGQIVSQGQLIMLRNLAKYHTVVVKWINGTGEVTHAHHVQPDTPIEAEPCSETDLAAFFKSWADYCAACPVHGV